MPASPNLIPRHLLIVDDQRLDRAIASYAATQTGMRVTAVGSINETRALLEDGTLFDFVVLDLSLGSDDGLEVLPLIARFNPTAVVILASGFDGRALGASHRLASSLGLLVAGVLRKPILPTALQRLLRHRALVSAEDVTLYRRRCGHQPRRPKSRPCQRLARAGTWLERGRRRGWKRTR